MSRETDGRSKQQQSFDDRFEQLWAAYTKELEREGEHVPSMYIVGAQILDLWRGPRMPSPVTGSPG